MRGSDPDAAVYYLARMLSTGEDVVIARIMICASEDVGNADPRALEVAVAASLAVERIRHAGKPDHPFTRLHPMLPVHQNQFCCQRYLQGKGRS